MTDKTSIILAPAKVNLNLAVTGRNEAGYHQLLSLVVFTSFGDKLHITPAPHHHVTLSGPFGPALDKAGGDALLAKSAALFQEVCGEDTAYHIHLEKQIPLGGGLGGGSADAGAFLRFLARNDHEKQILRDQALFLGADVPACFDSHMQIMSAAGEQAHYCKAPQDLPVMVLVNPHCHADTTSIFRAFKDKQTAFSTLDQQNLADWAHTGSWDKILEAGNDLSAVAIALYPAIGDMLTLMKSQGQKHGSDFIGASMTGSGASAFALFQNEAAAKSYEMDLQKTGLWAVSTAIKTAP